MLGSIQFFLSDNRREKKLILSERVLIGECKTVPSGRITLLPSLKMNFVKLS